VTAKLINITWPKLQTKDAAWLGGIIKDFEVKWPVAKYTTKLHTF